MSVGLWVAGGLLVLLGLAEIYARVVLGLGNPPLWMADREIEYLAQPSKSYRRFGNRITYNAYSMRSRDFARQKADPAELRVLVTGDSIVNGGAETDQEALATTLLERRLSEALGRPVVVGNVSAGSWGPPNFLAYFNRFGLFDCDVLVMVVNSRDYADAPNFRPLAGRNLPEHRPLLALQELWTKYLPRYLGEKLETGDHSRPPPVSAEDVKMCLAALREVTRLARASGTAVVLAQHLRRTELQGKPETGHHEIARVAAELGIEPVQLGPAFARSLQEGLSPYHDRGHPNDHGQRIIAEVLYESILEALSTANV